MNSILSSPIDLKSKTEFRAVDIAKMICALMVVSIHIDLFGTNNPVYALNLLSIFASDWFSRVAVPFFFMAAGFFLFRKIPYGLFDWSLILKYVKRLFILYLLWSFIYFPFQMTEFELGSKSFGWATVSYIYHFIFIGSYTHLWYLPALIVAIILVSICISKRISLYKILIVSGIFYLIGLLGNSWYGLTALITKHFSLQWNLSDIILRVFGTTRNGIFFAFLFVALGAFCAYEQVHVSVCKSGILLLLFYALMLLEVIFLRHMNFPKEKDMTLFLVPTVFFMFLFFFGLRIENDDVVYKKLRFCSSVTYFSHMFVWGIISKILSMTGLMSVDTPFMYWLVVLFCIIGTIAIDFLSRYKYFKWMKMLF